MKSVLKGDLLLHIAASKGVKLRQRRTARTVRPEKGLVSKVQPFMDGEVISLRHEVTLFKYQPMNALKIIKGYFWDPEYPELKQYGEIVFTEDNRRFLLNVKGFLKSFGSRVFDINYHGKIPSISGFSMDGEWLIVGGLRILDIVGSLTLDPLHSRRTEVELDADYLLVSKEEQGLANLKEIKRIVLSPQFASEYESESTFECDTPLENFLSPTFLTKVEDFLNYKLKAVKAVEIPFELARCLFKPDYDSLPLHPEDQLEIKKQYDFVFTFADGIDLEELQVFLYKVRQLFSLLIGTYISIDNIKISSQLHSFAMFYFKGNKRNIYYPSGIPADHRYADLETIIKHDSLNNFFSNYDSIKLALRHYFDFIESEKDTPHQELLLLVSALESTFNRRFKTIHSTTEGYPRVAKEILELDCLTAHQKDFLKNFKNGKRLKTFKIKEKILQLIEDSPKLLDLIKDPITFVEEILEVRHYIVHEANPASLDLYNNEIKLRRYNMKLKVILEYYLLMDIGFDGEYLDVKIHRTLVNMVQFR